MCARSASRLCECWLPDERPAPNCVLHHQRHAGLAAGHERQLRGLVHDLVQARADEVEVHHLDDRLRTGHRRADTHTHDRDLRDRRVDDPTGELVGKAAGDPEDASAGGHVDACHPDRRVVVAARGECATHRIHRPVERCVGIDLALVHVRSGALDVVGHRGGRRFRRRARRGDRNIDLVVHLARRSLSGAPSAPRRRGVGRRGRLDPWTATRRLRRRCGSARGHPRSGRASGTSTPR